MPAKHRRWANQESSISTARFLRRSELAIVQTVVSDAISGQFP